MALETQQLTRAFRYNSVDLADPGVAYTPSQVRDFYAAVYPEITTAAIEGPETADGKMVYEFRRAVGTKGAEEVSLLQIINAHMHEGVCPSAGCIGECAIIYSVDERSPNSYEAQLYIWDQSFNDSSAVAEWFKAVGASNVWISHTLFSDANEDRDGRCFDGPTRNWVVAFDMEPNALLPATQQATPAAICAGCGSTITAEDVAKNSGCPRCQAALH